LDRIFSTTTFNEKKIWEPNNGARKKVGEELKQAVSFRMQDGSYDITNDNCGVVAYGGYQIKADENGVSVGWKGYDGNDYETRKIDWNTLKANKYSFEMSDYFDNPANANSANLVDANGDALFTQKIAFAVQEVCTVDDIIACIDGVYISSSEWSGISARYEDGTGTQVRKDVWISGTYLDYGAAYASNANKVVAGTDGVYNFDGSDDLVIEPADGSGNVLNGGTVGNITKLPSATDVASARSSNEGWEMTFYMDGIGKVTATSESVNYWATNASNWNSDEKDLWWYEYEYDGHSDNYILNRTVDSGTLGDVMSVLTGEWNDPANPDKTTPGLLTEANGGSAKNGGIIEVNFKLAAENDFTYANVTDSFVGWMYLRIDVDATDTEQTVLNKIQDALNSNTIVDFQKDGANYDKQYTYSPTANSHDVNVPIWGGINAFYVQAGTEGGQHISVDYECLSVAAMKMQDTNVLTVEDSENAINEIKSALQMVSTQRSDFGAYQNRLEHAVNANENTEENTQAAESVIRDTDMAKTMVEYSNFNILLQAGQTMLAQANQSNQAILSLLQ